MALKTGLTLSFDLQDRTTKDGLSRITKYFEQAGGALRYLHNHFSHAPSMDMQPQTLTMLVQLMMVRLFFSTKHYFVFNSYNLVLFSSYNFFIAAFIGRIKKSCVSDDP